MNSEADIVNRRDEGCVVAETGANILELDHVPSLRAAERMERPDEIRKRETNNKIIASTGAPTKHTAAKATPDI